MEDITKIDIYELLGISSTADEKEVKSAYRKKALTCHPDKNPDNPKAAELFQQLSKALEILTDTKAKAAYDQVLKARKAAKVRDRELDSKRKKLKEDLEAREQASKDTKDTDTDAKKLQAEIERLRKEGSRLVEEEQERLRQQIIDERSHPKNAESELQTFPRLKVKWKVPKGSPEGTGYTESDLYKILGKHGDITCLVMSKKKQGSAVVEFATIEAAKSAMESEHGNPDIPLKFSWIGTPPEESQTRSNFNSVPKSNAPPPFVDGSSTLTARDYESIVLMKLRQAEERKRLIQQMMEDDAAADG